MLGWWMPCIFFWFLIISHFHCRIRRYNTSESLTGISSHYFDVVLFWTAFFLNIDFKMALKGWEYRNWFRHRFGSFFINSHVIHRIQILSKWKFSLTRDYMVNICRFRWKSTLNRQHHQQQSNHFLTPHDSKLHYWPVVTNLFSKTIALNFEMKATLKRICSTSSTRSNALMHASQLRQYHSDHNLLQ